VNQASKDTRVITSNNAGYFAFPGMVPGIYMVTVEASSFKIWRQADITMDPGDIRKISGIVLAVGNPAETITVEAVAGEVSPVDSGERSSVLTAKDVDKLPLVSRNLTELLKILPGVTSTANGTGNGLGFDFTNAGASGSAVGVGLSTNGAPYRGGTALLLDGANIIDPGCDCWSTAVANPDMTQEVKVQSSAFGADSQAGPVVVNNISKSGSASYHGEGYLYARNGVLNANTWANNHQVPLTPEAARQTARPDQAYYYPGGNFGGPVPGTHKKLLFWGGYEYFWQNLPAAQPLESYVPSAGMQSGNFTSSGAGNAALCPGGFTASATNWCNDLTGTVAPDGTPIAPGVIPSQFLDPGGLALLKLFPAANANPASTPGGFNYFLPVSSQHNGYIYRARVDYNLNDNNKVFVSYQYASDSATLPAHIYYSPTYAVGFAGGNIVSPTKSRTLTGSFLHIFSSSLTNEFVAAWAFLDNPITASKIQNAYKSTIGYPYGTVFNNGAKMAPSVNQAGDHTFPDVSQPDLFESGGAFDTRKATPSFSDNLTKVYRSHTFKAGFFTQNVGNLQGTYGYPNGSLWFSSGLLPDVNNPTVSIGSLNPVANLLMGVANQGVNNGGFTQNSVNPVTDMAYRVIAAYGMDSWKVTNRLTVNVGFRFDHIGHWYDRQGVGMAVWLPGRIAGDLAAGKPFPGVYWHGIDPGIPNGGSPSRILFTSPRVGMALDLFGTGKTVLRGGWGAYRWNDQYNDYAGPLQSALGAKTYNSPRGEAITLKEINALGQTGGSLGNLPSSVYAANPSDYEVPVTYAYNFTISQRVPWKSLVEVAYVGSNSSKLLMGGQSGSAGIGGSGFTNVNKIPLGGLFKPDPVTGAPAPTDPENVPNITDYYPYQSAYGSNAVNVTQHVGYSNYNGLQLSWLKQTGRVSYNVNYTWSKSLGIVNNTVDAFTVHGNYGVLNIDRPHVINTSYSFDLGRPYHGSRMLEGATDGWTIAGTTTWQAGGNLQALTNTQNLGLALKYAAGGNLTSNTYFGTPSQEILPITTCNPASGLASHQLANLSCFTPPPIGQQGDRQFPYLSGPAYFNSDLAIYKTFAITERQHVQFRLSAFNFINHPLWAFSSNNDVTLKYVTSNGTSFTPNVASGLPPNYTWGSVDTKTTQRVLELALKYSF
jgi:hypothetical protein